MSSKHESTTLRKLIRGESVGGITLIIAALFAMFVVNIPSLQGVLTSLGMDYVGWLQFSETFNAVLEYKVTIVVEHTVRYWINDLLMAIFFFTIGLEVKRELFDPKGSLNTWGKRALPGVVAVAGVTLPAAIFVFFNSADALAMKGWAVPTATDIAFALGVLMLVGSKRVPLSVKVFLLAIAVLDDLIAVGVIALFYSADLNLTALAGAGLVLSVLVVQNLRNSNNFMSYGFLGVALWGCTLASGIHPTVAGLVTALTIPTTAKLGGNYSLLKTWEHELSPINAWVIMPLFALANAGVNLAGVSSKDLFNSVTLGVTLALVFGKPIAVIGSAWLTTTFTSAELPEGMTMKHLIGVGLLTGIGFTMSIFVAGLAYKDIAGYGTYSILAVLISSSIMAVIGFMWCRLVFPEIKEEVVHVADAIEYKDNHVHQQYQDNTLVDVDVTK
tara:strand:+ start:242618 stop:243949 length:1332 start_codon:yes stop_codon:yes gene_type:complete